MALVPYSKLVPLGPLSLYGCMLHRLSVLSINPIVIITPQRWDQFPLPPPRLVLDVEVDDARQAPREHESVITHKMLLSGNEQSRPLKLV